jgi:GrpB-like predicted nucleotidyltransferase (UPF0157 family)
VPELTISAYDPLWVESFRLLQQRLARWVMDIADSIEHVGSTSVPGLAAKPIIDLDVVTARAETVPELIARLAGLGYRHEGDLGIAGREAFQAPDTDLEQHVPEHHLYVVVAGTKPHLDHVLLRDYLRSHPDEVRRYAQTKWELARRLAGEPQARSSYWQAKSPLVEDLVGRAYAWRATDHGQAPG